MPAGSLTAEVENLIAIIRVECPEYESTCVRAELALRERDEGIANAYNCADCLEWQLALDRWIPAPGQTVWLPILVGVALEHLAAESFDREMAYREDLENSLEYARRDLDAAQRSSAQHRDRIRALEDLLRRALPLLGPWGALQLEVDEILPWQLSDDLGPVQRVAAPAGERTGWDPPPTDVVERFERGELAYRPSAWVLAAWHACFCIECPVSRPFGPFSYTLPCPNEREIPYVFYRGTSEGSDAQRMLIGERKWRRKMGLA